MWYSSKPIIFHIYFKLLIPEKSILKFIFNGTMPPLTGNGSVPGACPYSFIETYMAVTTSHNEK